MAESNNSNNVKSVTKAFHIIEALDKAEELSISELSNMLEMDKTTVHRIISTIKDCGFVTQNPKTKKYANSMKFYTLGRNVIQKNELGLIGRPYIRQIAQITGETVNLGIRVGNSVVYIDRAQNETGIQVATTTGKSIPMHCTGMGKAIMAQLSPQAQDEVINETNLVAYTHNTAISRESVMEKLKEVETMGIAIDHEEFEIGLIAFGAPIFNADGEPFAAISISCPTVRYNEQRQKELFTKLLSDAATIISMKMGYDTNG